MSRSAGGSESTAEQTERTVARLAHAFTPAEWTRRWLVIMSIVFVAVAALTVVQRALVSDSPMAWTFTAVHGAIVAIAVPVLIVRTVREWREAQASTGVPE